MVATPRSLYRAWTKRFDRWFAVPGSVAIRATVGSPYFFETEFEGRRHPHFGRFLRLVPARLVELTWVTATTKGRGIVVTVRLRPRGTGSTLRLTHRKFPTLRSRDRHATAWPVVLAHRDEVCAWQPARR
jgi:uncharacterized protein YndB with AHSA1/START domain